MDNKILIIGAGASGIAAAIRLIELGYQNLKILEVQNRIGGRICTIPFGENVLDLGAQWCHGEKGNIVYKIAKNYNNDIFGSTNNLLRNIICIKSNKEILSQEITLKLVKIIKECLESDESIEELKEFKGSLEEFLNKKFKNALEKPENADLDIETAKQFLNVYKKFHCSLDACDTLSELSGANELTYWECEGDGLLNWKEKGYITILRILMKATKDKPYGILENKILFNKKVEEICWQENNEGKVHVNCSDGDKIYANHIICTVSLGVLKENYKKLFNPILPLKKIHAIEGLGFGNVDKMFIEFSQPFWPENWYGVCMLWEKDDLENIRKRNDSWIEDVFGIYRVDYQPNILCGLIVGVEGRKMENAPDEEVKNGLMFLLRKFLKWDIPEPKNFIRSTWYNNPNARGSYSFRSIKAEELNAYPADLASPLFNDKNNFPILQFAGEATHDHYFSTVHGAIESGLREANRLYRYFTDNKPENV